MSSDAKVINKLKGIKPYYVLVGNNFFTGREYKYTHWNIVVLETSHSNATSIAEEYEGKITEYFKEKRVHQKNRSIRLLRKSESQKTKIIGSFYMVFKDKGYALDSSGNWVEFDSNDF